MPLEDMLVLLFRGYYIKCLLFVNARIVEEGYAQSLTIPPDVKYAGTFLKLEREAREKNKGLWKGSSGESLF